MNERVRTLIIQFENPISRFEIPYFRGAILSSVNKDSILFHNHIDDGFRYAYPLIQYKRIGGKAAIVAVGEGTDAIGEFFANRPLTIGIGNRTIELTTQNIEANNTLVQLWQEAQYYNLRGWVPFNSENWQLYNQTESVAEQYAMLERILQANILSMLKGMNIHIDEHLSCAITHVVEQRVVKYKGVKVSSFDIQFKANISIPKFVGIGKGVSLGHGIVTPQRHNTQPYNHNNL